MESEGNMTPVILNLFTINVMSVHYKEHFLIIVRWWFQKCLLSVLESCLSYRVVCLGNVWFKKKYPSFSSCSLQVPVHLRTSWEGFYAEILALAGLAAYALNFFAGRSKNSRLATAWWVWYDSINAERMITVNYLIGKKIHACWDLNTVLISAIQVQCSNQLS